MFLKVQNLSKDFGGVRAVKDLSFSIKGNTIHSIIGPNGAGKTTLFNLITGIYPPSGGAVVFQNTEITGMPSHDLVAHGISRTFQNLQIFQNMTVEENVMVGRHLSANTQVLPTVLRLPSVTGSDRECRERAQEFLEFVGLVKYQHERADSLPYGGLKRLEIARALATEPKLLLLDEPAAGCNARETQEIDGLIRRIVESGVTVVLVEHDMRLVMGVSDLILVLDSGRKLAEGTAAEVRENPAVIQAYLGAWEID